METGQKAAIAVLILLLSWVIIMRIRRASGVWRVRHFAYPQSWLDPLHDHVEVYARLPWELRAPLQDLMVAFMDSKKWRSFGKLAELPDDIKIPVAANACLLLLNRSNPGLYLAALTLHVYPADFFKPGEPMTEERPGSTALLVWDESAKHVHDVTDHDNKALERAAAELTDSHASIKPSRLSHSTWARILSTEFKARFPLPEAAANYTNEEFPEFFAIATEAFYHCPEVLNKKHPQLYSALRGFYKIDPCRWTLA